MAPYAPYALRAAIDTVMHGVVREHLETFPRSGQEMRLGDWDNQPLPS
jgi:hypothetical protein